MSDYAIVNLLDLDDVVGDRLEGLEGRFARTALESSELGVSRFTYEPNVRNPIGHTHREQEEAYVVVGGSGRMRLDDEIREIRQWDVVRVAPQVLRGFESGADGLDLIAIGSRKPEGGDGEVSDRPWPDAAG
jgi:mannose-6-phosphate isomerase-like protein (cupin superfamily)